jgi:hypothetical protein
MFILAPWCATSVLLALLGAIGPTWASYDFEFFCRSDTVQRVDPSGVADFYFTIRNAGAERDCYEFNCRVIQEVSNWFVMYCVGGLCAFPGVTLRETLAAGETDTLVHLSVATDTTSGEEIVNLSVRSTGNPALSDSVTTHTLAGAGIEERLSPCCLPRLGLSAAPNPVRRQTTISYEIPRVPGRDLWFPSSSLSLYDHQGRRWLTVAAPGSDPGRHEFHWLRPSRLPGGIYLLRLSRGSQSAWQKIVVEE